MRIENLSLMDQRWNQLSTKGFCSALWGDDLRPISLHFFLLAVAFLMSGAAVLASASVSNPSTAENLRPIA